MGDLVAMTSSTAPARFRPKPVGETAEILFFTGVRYYRMPDAPPAKPPVVRRRRAARRPEAARLDCQA